MVTTIPTITNEQVNSIPFLFGVLEDLGIRTTLDAQIPMHGAWQGASLGTLVTLWLTRILSERSHCLVDVRSWATMHTQTLAALLGAPLRDTDCTDDRLAHVLTLLGAPATQITLDRALVRPWLRLYHLPTRVLRLDSSSVSVYHEPTDPTSLLQHGHSKDHRPDLRQFKAMLASLDPLGLPVVCQPVAGHRADEGLYVPVFDAATATLGTTDLLAVGDSKMGSLGTRGHIVATGSRYLCVYHPPTGRSERTAWEEDALAHRERWHALTRRTPGERAPHPFAVVDSWDRLQTWIDPTTQHTHEWTERVLLVRTTGYQAGQRRRYETALQEVTTDLALLWQPPKRGRKRYRTAAELADVVAGRIAAAGLTGVLKVTLTEETADPPRWVVESIAVNSAAWAALIARLGWRVYVTNTTAAEYPVEQVVAVYHQQPVLERGFARLKSRTLQIRPVYVRDEQRIAGLLWLLTLALRVLVLTEYQVRQALATTGEALVGLNPASRTQGTERPTTERLIGAFANLTLTTIHAPAGGYYHHITPLNSTQQAILRLLKLPSDLYTRVAHNPANCLHHLRE